MKKRTRKIIALICILPILLGALNIGEISKAYTDEEGVYDLKNIEQSGGDTSRITEFAVNVKYPDDKGYVEATVDEFVVEFKLHINDGVAGDELNINFDNKEKIDISKKEFILDGGVFKLEATENGVKLVALDSFVSSDITLRIPTVFSKNEEGLKKIKYSIDELNLSKEVEVNVKKAAVKFGEGKLLKKSSFNALSEDSLQWGIYYNYLGTKITANTIKNYIFKEQVGEGLELIPESIAAYNVENHLLEGNIINDNPIQHYNYDLSNLLQSRATDKGWIIQLDDEARIDDLSLNKSLYIHYETKVIDGDFGREYTNEVSLDGILDIDGDGTIYEINDRENVKYHPVKNGTGFSEEILKTVSFTKVDKETLQPIEDNPTIFALINGEGKTIFGYMTTNSKGVLVIRNVPVGKYQLKEVEAPKGYVLLTESFEFELTNGDDQLDYTITNTKSDKTPITDIIIVGGTGSVNTSVEKQLSSFNVSRIAGKDRYETAVEVSKTYDKNDTAVISSGITPTDQLTATVLAKKLDTPILLTKKNEVPEVTKAELERLGVKKIILIGGAGTISTSVEKILKGNYGTGNVSRIGGINRYETAVLIGEKIREITGNKDEAVIVDGTNFPDAISMTSMAVKKDVPILLTAPAQLSKETEKALEKWDIENIVIGGGTGSVHKGTEDEIKQEVSKVSRIGGKDRYETSTLVAAAVYKTSTQIVLASGELYADAIISAPFAANKSAPVVLTKAAAVPDVVMNYLTGK